MKKILYIILGCVCLSAVGAVLPLLPAFPFLMLAAFCFARSSQRLHNWFVPPSYTSATWKTSSRAVV